MNLDKLLTELKRRLSKANFTEHALMPSSHIGAAGARAVPFVELLVRRATVEAVYFEGLELWEQVVRMREVDVLVGATGSGLTNLAFLEPGAMVIELASRHYEQQFFDMLVLRVHGSLLRGTISYRKSYAKAVHLTADGSIGRAIKADGSDNPGRSFNVVANVSDVARVLLEELQHRARGWWREGE